MKTFVKNDHSFVCGHCGRQVGKLSYTSRNHCPHCLYSLHVDINPGDRANDCGALMKPIGVEMSGKKGMVLVFACTKCGAIGRNKAADDDDYAKILKLSAHEEADW